MEFVLEVRPPEGKLFYVRLPGQGSVTIGREPPADIVLPDQFVSREHLQLQFANGLWYMTDTGSSNGTFVNGVRQRRSELNHGDTIYAGRSVLRLSAMVEGKPALRRLPEEPMSFMPWQFRLLTVVEESCNFAVLDGAIGPAVRDLLNLAGVFYQSLYEGEQAVELAPFGPFLVEIKKGTNLLPFLIKTGWGNAWGVYLKASVEFEQVRAHFRRFLLVNTEDGQRLIFRFYDPRVLRIFLPSCDEVQRKEFFGPIQAFLTEGEAEGNAVFFRVDREETHSLR